MQEHWSRMNKMGPRLGCESCRKWQEHCYQEHTVRERASFVRLMAGDFARGILTETLSLKSPSGATWLVDVARNADADELLLGSGWGDFARAHELQEDDLVVFTRGGGGGSGSGCSFDVLVLDSSGCEKAPCFFAANKGQGGDGDRLAAGSSYCCYYYSRSSGTLLTGGERDQMRSLVSVQPGNPAFVTVLMKTHVGHKNSMLTVHHGFAAEHLEGRSHEVLLLRPNREERWCVRYYHASHTRGFNCRRWVKFVRENRLRKDHVCVFELIKGATRTTMLVHVLRKADGRLALVA
ncbi:B3 domain-containing protein [Zea mays]|uniref:B3 domain-containing protein n=1 Tax=Zea mays TaxID=4577 RepID=A0A1D6KEY8_MAIZE|nr:B3 domain-containing protein [Zea mays]